MPPATSEQKQILSRDKEALALQKIRPELNLEKWPVWQPAKSKNAPRARTLRREVALADGSKVAAKVKIGFTDEGALTTEDQKTYYALVQHWEEHGAADSPVAFSLQRIAKRLNKKWGTNVIEALTDSLVRLRTTPFVWENSYFDGASQETLELLTAFNILSDLKIAKRKKDGVVIKEAGYFRFNEFILKNLQTNNTKPVLFDVILSFNSEIAQLVYTHIDLILADKLIYERRTIELLEDLCISGKEYRKPSVRKRVLEKALKELVGKRLSKGGVITSATVEKTKDGKDYKVVFRKGAAKVPAIAGDTPEQDAAREAPQDATSQDQRQPTDAEQKGEELLRYFHKVFFGLEATATRSRHRDLATALVAQHGWDVATYIVDFSHTAAQETNFKIATFGGITQYVDRAVAHYHERKREQDRRQQAEVAAAEDRRRESAEAAARGRAQERYEKLPEAERQALTDAYTAKLCAENPMWAEAKEKGTTGLLNAAARSAILDDFTADERAGRREASATPQE